MQFVNDQVSFEGSHFVFPKSINVAATEMFLEYQETEVIDINCCTGNRLLLTA